MKYGTASASGNSAAVAPLAGAWIEIVEDVKENQESFVAPLAGAWIEIPGRIIRVFDEMQSLPSRERGLKYKKLI